MASATVAKLNVHLGLNAQALLGGLKQSQSALQSFGGQFANIASAFGGGNLGGGIAGAIPMLGSLATKAGIAGLAIGGLAAAAGVGKWAAGLAAEAHASSIAFEVMLGSAEKAKTMLADIRQFALESPFETQGLTQAAQVLMQFGVEGEKILPTLKMIGDVSLGDSEKMDRLALAFGQMSSAGKLMGQDLLQMINAGFNPLQEISKITGRSMADLRKDMEAGAISSEMVTAAFQSATGAGGRFHGMMAAMQNTLKGQWSKLMENLAVTFMPVGKFIVNMLIDILKMLNRAIEGFNWLFGSATKQVKKAKDVTLDLDKVFKDLGKNSKLPDVVDEVARAFTELKKQGESLTDSLRTPLEKFADDIRDAKMLFENNVISGETFARAMAKARQELDGQAKSAREMRDSLSRGNQPVAALQFGTQAAISAVSAAQREQKLQLEVEKQMLLEQKAANLRLKQIEAAIRGSKPVNVQEVNL